MNRVIPFLESFETLEDPRIDRKKLYPLNEILLITLSAVICGADSGRDLVTFGEEKLEHLKRYLPFKHGVPCKNTFSRLFASINPEQFKTCFLSWIDSFQRVFKTVAIDGKTLRRSHDKIHNQSAIHSVSAFATEARLVLGQLKVSDKSNDITAIPE